MLKLGLKKNDCRWGCYSSEKENKDNCTKKRLFDDLPANNEEVTKKRSNAKTIPTLIRVMMTIMKSYDK